MLLDEAPDRIKEYNKWNEKKKTIEFAQEKKILFKEGEIWWCSIGINVGNEVFGKGEYYSRPVLIIKKLSHNSAIILPLSSKAREGTWFTEILIQEEKNWVMLNQIRMTHSKRLIDRLCTIKEEDFTKVRKELKYLLKLDS